MDVGTKEVKSAAVPVSSLFGGEEYVKVKKTDWNKIVTVFRKALQEQAEQRFDVLVKQMAASEDVTEKLKECYPGEGRGDCEGGNYILLIKVEWVTTLP